MIPKPVPHALPERGGRSRRTRRTARAPGLTQGRRPGNGGTSWARPGRSSSGGGDRAGLPNAEAGGPCGPGADPMRERGRGWGRDGAGPGRMEPRPREHSPSRRPPLLAAEKEGRAAAQPIISRRMGLCEAGPRPGHLLHCLSESGAVRRRW